MFRVKRQTILGTCWVHAAAELIAIFGLRCRVWGKTQADNLCRNRVSDHLCLPMISSIVVVCDPQRWSSSGFLACQDKLGLLWCIDYTMEKRRVMDKSDYPPIAKHIISQRLPVRLWRATYQNSSLLNAVSHLQRLRTKSGKYSWEVFYICLKLFLPRLHHPHLTNCASRFISLHERYFVDSAHFSYYLCALERVKHI